MTILRYPYPPSMPTAIAINSSASGKGRARPKRLLIKVASKHPNTLASGPHTSN